MIISFTGSSLLVQTDESKSAEFPADFDLQTDDREEPPPDIVKDPREPVSVNRRLIFTAGTVNEGPPKFERITDQHLTDMMGTNMPIRRLRSVEGTPLIDLLDEPDLFPKFCPHVTVNGSLTLTGIVDDMEEEPCLMNPSIRVGRLTRVLHEWRN